MKEITKHKINEGKQIKEPENAQQTKSKNKSEKK